LFQVSGPLGLRGSGEIGFCEEGFGIGLGGAGLAVLWLVWWLFFCLEDLAATDSPTS
jgi:hypothetical protein